MTASVATLVRMELANLARRGLLWILVGILAAYILLVMGSFLLLLAAPPDQGFGAEVVLGPLRALGLPYVAALYSSIASILIIVFVSSLVGHEFTRGTLRTLLLMRAGRTPFALSKLATVLVACSASTLLGLLVTLAAAAAFGAVAGEDFLHFDGGVGEIALTLASVVLRLMTAVAVWGVIAYALTLLTRSLLAGIGITLAVQILGDFAVAVLSGLGDVGTWFGRALPNAAVMRITSPPTLDFDATDAAWVLANLTAYLVVPTWWAIHRFRRLDILAATKNG